MKIVLALASSTFITDIIASTNGLDESDFLRNILFPRFPHVFSNKVPRGTTSNQNGVLSKNSSTYKMADHKEQRKFLRRIQEERVCTPCPDGSDIMFPDFVVDMIGQPVVKCVDHASYTISVGSSSEDDCQYLQYVNSISCGCPPPLERRCTLCESGEMPPYPNKIIGINGNNITCQQFELLAAWTEGSMCMQAQGFGQVDCGCPSAPEPICSLCADGGMVPNPDQIITDSSGESITCEELGLLSRYRDPQSCKQTQFLGYTDCGCSSPPEASCSLCLSGEDIPDPDKVISITLGKETYNFSCGEVAVIAAGLEGPAHPEGQQCSQLQNYGRNECGCTSGDKSDECVEGRGDGCVDRERCLDKSWKIFQFDSQNRKAPNQTITAPCAWLNTISEENRLSICAEDGVRDVCPSTCDGDCLCRDNFSNEFQMEGQNTKSCLWLSKLKKKNIRMICKFKKGAKETCPDTCAGWCTFKEKLCGSNIFCNE